jgi:superfamily II DNA or RNA helicase
MDECSTYLGQKGYSIYKESLTTKEEQYIREELNVRPYIPKAPIQPNPFPIYRESSGKLYVPRYFGIDNYGSPDQIRITNGSPINISFHGELKPFQKDVVDTYLKKTQNKSNYGGGGLLDIPCGHGKTVLALNIISQLQCKTIIIVHKSFLMNQWIERIEQFLPGARIGKIQGQTIDIEDKDIVIGMLQSLSMKAYPSDLFKDFGLTVVDEVHHISSEVFSRSLCNIVTKYTLGLSATMKRKDGLTRVFKLFLGDIIYKIERSKKDCVLVKAIDYQTSDEEFNEVEVDYRGNTKYSTMISKICTFNPRSEFILRILKQEIKDNPNKQILVLGQYKNILIYLFKAIEQRSFASVGYYLGGMKENVLKESESKQIIIATYAMAAEALDIKTLSTLVLATPKTDIVQAVGRILRTQSSTNADNSQSLNESQQPTVIDIIDQHAIFKRQWGKRKTYFMKQNYKIIHTNNDLYYLNEDGGSNTWTILFDPDEKKKSEKEGKKGKKGKKEEKKGVCVINLD